MTERLPVGKKQRFLATVRERALLLASIRARYRDGRPLVLDGFVEDRAMNFIQNNNNAGNVNNAESAEVVKMRQERDDAVLELGELLEFQGELWGLLCPDAGPRCRAEIIAKVKELLG